MIGYQGFNLYMLDDLDGMLVVNRVISELTDLKFGNVLVQVMNRVIMDPEFEESVQPNDDEGDEN